MSRRATSKPKEPSKPVTTVDAATSHLWSWLLVLVPVMCNAVWLWPELIGAPSQADTAFHALMIERASEALASGRSPVDFWIPQLEFGFPQFLYYQHLPHLFVVGVHRALGGSVDLLSIFHALRWLLLVTFPLTVYWSARRLGWTMREAAVAGAAASLLSGDARFGFEYNSYVWRGFGMYTQLWAMHLSFVSLALVLRLLREGRGYAPTIVCLAVLALSQLLYAYMAAVTAILLLVLGASAREMLLRSTRLAVAGVASVAATLYMIVPFLQHKPFLSTFPSMPGASGVKAYEAGFLSTSILDHGRLPVLTLLLALGVSVAIMFAIQRRDHRARLALAGFVLWALLCFAGDKLGPVSLLLGTYGADVKYRFIGAMEMFAILLMGMGGGWLWDRIAGWRVVSKLAAPGARFSTPAVLGALAVLLWLAPAFVERASFYATNARWIRETSAAVANDADLNGVLTMLADSPAGRTYAGRPDNFSNSMMVGPILRVTDVIKARAIPGLVPPYQGLSLNTEMVWQFDDAEPSQYDLFDVRHVIVPAEAQVPPFYQPFVQTTRYHAYRVNTSGATRWIAADDRRPATSQLDLLRGNLAWLNSDLPAARVHVRWDYPDAPADRAAVTSTQRCVDIGQSFDAVVGVDSIVADVRCTVAGTLLFKTSYHPNWRVEADGVPVETFMVSPAFLAAAIPAGVARVQAVYTVTAGKHALLAFGAIVLLGVLLLSDRLERPASVVANRLGFAAP